MSESRNNYKKTDIKLNLINALRANYMTREDIRNFLSAEYKRLGKTPADCKNIAEYKVSERTVKRTIDSIKDSYGDQLEEEAGAYKLDLYDFPDTIDDTEIRALEFAIQKTANNLNERKLLENLKAKLTTRLYRKIEHTEPKRAASKINDIDQMINADFAFVGPRPDIRFDPNIKSLLDSAISKQHEIRFTYNNREHTVCPLGIMYGPNNVYLVAYICKNGKICTDPRYYIMADITNVIDTGNRFNKDNSFSLKTYAKDMFGIYNDGAVYDVEWLIKNPEVIKLVKKYQFHPTQKFINNPDGTLTIKMRTGGLRAICIYLTQWGGDIIPVKPKELLVEYKNLLKKCLDSMK